MTMKPMFQTRQEAWDEALWLGMIFNTHKQSDPRVQLMLRSNASKKIHRSPFRTTLLTYGETGTGKSSLINHLFNLDIPTNEYESETRSTSEFICERPYPLLGVSDLCLAIVDTPGYGDTNGVLQECANIECILKYLDEGLHKFFPNIVLLTLSATNKRPFGDQSGFTKSLKVSFVC